eukprot:Skav227490  [mRNA]  locus=scaffold282:104428:105264:+ [translate_table: standard]
MASASFVEDDNGGILMKNVADLRTLSICSAKWLILILVWNLHPYLGFWGKLIAGVLQCVWSFYVMTMVHNARLGFSHRWCTS